MQADFELRFGCEFADEFETKEAFCSSYFRRNVKSKGLKSKDLTKEQNALIHEIKCLPCLPHDEIKTKVPFFNSHFKNEFQQLFLLMLFVS